MSQLTTEQAQILHQANAAYAAGNEEEGVRLMKQIPLQPELARDAKEVFGAVFLRESGFDLSEAEREYGKNWLAS